MKLSASARFWSRVDKSDTCWLWLGCLDRYGYGKLKVAGRFVKAHQFAYRELVGEVPAGKELDHKCRVRRCVRPDDENHVRAATHRENVLSGETTASKNARKTHCCHGHPFDAKNTLIRTSARGAKRQCRACLRKNDE